MDRFAMRNIYFVFYNILRNLISMIFGIFSVKNNRILFSSTKGKAYSCNPKTISEFLQSNGKIDYEIIWINKGMRKTPPNVKLVNYRSLRYIYYYFTAKWIITNNGFKNEFKKPIGQYRLETWHGGGAYKKINNNHTNFQKYRCSLTGNEIDYFISSCKKFSDVMSNAEYVDRKKFLEIGMPRNDIFFDVEKVKMAKLKVMEILKLKDCKIVLYAPTWRDNGSTQEITDICKTIKLINQQTEQNFCLLCRAHHRGKIQGFEEDIFDVTDYPDMQELLCAADVLITDYSSCMWDFSLMYKPCFIYATDIEYYEQERNFYTPMSEWPFPIARNSNELVHNIVCFDNEKYIKDVKKHHNSLGICEDGHACEKICKIIEEKCCGDL